eukprot:TRINITY_DN3461_c0_g1_i1.p1 TRINITY_DN3461_c0_g1~~TRINITY_DN3461_c0_g1_i1.p1  ORF type:complete len:626 (+),score=143.96 TRINITY_DN3461_c0_g1_i1:279-2156(+)
MVTIQYRGFKLVASSLLPISSKTLSYGSSDGGKTIYKSNTELNELMEKAGKYFNIKEHRILDKEIFMPADIEGHQGLDGHLYVLDTARLFPPSEPSTYLPIYSISKETMTLIEIPQARPLDTIQEILLKGRDEKIFRYFKTMIGFMCFVDDKNEDTTNTIASKISGVLVKGDSILLPFGYKGRFLTDLFRYDFLKSYSTPLSSDAFSMFGRDCSNIHNAEVRKASYYLRTDVLDRFITDVEINKSVNIFDGCQLTSLIHKYGIPVRMLGLLLNKIFSFQSLIFTEMISRVLCDILREILRSFKGSNEDDLSKIILKNFNLMFGVGGDTSEYYKLAVVSLLQIKFDVSSICEKASQFNFVQFSNYEFAKKINKIAILNRIEQKTGIKIEGAYESIKKDEFFFNKQNPFEFNSKINYSSLSKSIIEPNDIFNLFESTECDPELILETINEQKSPLYNNLRFVYTIKLANKFLDNKQFTEGKKILYNLLGIHEIKDFCQIKILPFEVAISSWFLLGEIFLQEKQPSKAAFCFYNLFNYLLQTFKSEPFTSRTATQDKASPFNHPFAIVVTHKLVNICLNYPELDELSGITYFFAGHFSLLCYKYKNLLDSPKVRKELFGEEVPRPIFL